MLDAKFHDAMNLVWNGEFSHTRDYDAALRDLLEMCAAERHLLAYDEFGVGYADIVSDICLDFVMRVYFEGKQIYWLNAREQSCARRLGSIVLSHCRGKLNVHGRCNMFADEADAVRKMLDDEEAIVSVVEQSVGNKLRQTLQSRRAVKAS